jgi:hypothetical protein
LVILFEDLKTHGTTNHKYIGNVCAYRQQKYGCGWIRDKIRSGVGEIKEL